MTAATGSRFDRDALGGEPPKPSEPDLENGYAKSGRRALGGARPVPHGRNFTLRERWFDELPGLEALDSLAEYVGSENRDDRVITVGATRMLDDGRMMLDDGRAIPFEQPAFEQFMARLTEKTRGATEYLSNCPVELRALDVNHWIAEQRRVKEKSLMFRTRNGAGVPRIFSVCGPRYPRADVDVVARVLKDIAPVLGQNEIKVRSYYNGYRASIQLLWRSDNREIPIEGIELCTSDVGDGAQKVSHYALILVCLNGMMAPGWSKVNKKVHVGKVDGMLDRLRDGVAAAARDGEVFTEAWAKLPSVEIEDVGEEFAALVKGKRVSVPGFTNAKGRAEVVTNLVKAHATQGHGSTAHGVVSAVTYAAHAYDWRQNSPGARWTIQEDLERQAGQLVYAYARVTRAQFN